MSKRRGVGYTRISQDGSASIQRQKRRIKQYIEDHDMELVRIYDDGQYASGYDEERTEYMRLLQDAESQNFDAVIVDDGNRLGREIKQRIIALYHLDEYDIEMHAVEYGYVNADEPKEVLFEVFRATTDEQAKRAEIEKAREATEHRIEQGYDHGGPPYGFRFDTEGKYWVPGENYETALEVIVMREQDHSYTQIVEELGVSRGTAHRIVDSKEMYRQFSECDDCQERSRKEEFDGE